MNKPKLLSSASIIDTIIAQARSENKNILIIGAARSGTHALGSTIAKHGSFDYLGELDNRPGPIIAKYRPGTHPKKFKDENGLSITPKDDLTSPPRDIYRLNSHGHTIVAQIVQLTLKIKLSGMIHKIKEHSIIVNLRHRDKVAQYSSLRYARDINQDFKKWHNYTPENTIEAINQLTATQEDINQFMNEQMVDSHFDADYTLYYEDLTFDSYFVEKNNYIFDITKMFTNLDFVELNLKSWKYPDDE